MSFLVCSVGGTESGSTAARPVYIIKLVGREEPIYGYVEEKDWNKEMIPVELDTPWRPGVEYVKESNIESKAEEYEGNRPERIKAGWAKLGYTEVNGLWLRTEEVKWANLARDAAGISSEPESPTAPEASRDKPVGPDKGQPEPPVQSRGILAQRGPQLTLAIAAVLLLAIVGKITFLPRRQ